VFAGGEYLNITNRIVENIIDYNRVDIFDVTSEEWTAAVHSIVFV
jgi:hypothetical protein